jgi:hypothetical protein
VLIGLHKLASTLQEKLDAMHASHADAAQKADTAQAAGGS